jgi:catechol 2,3-dioxygenase-like lactoylglutathione lyase family enzyme
MTTRLGPILSATVTTPDIDRSVQDYVDHLYMTVADRRPVPRALADSWGAPAVAGNQMVLLKPQSGEPGWVRFVEGEVPEDYAPFQTFGWTAIELLVKNCDTLAEELKGTPFTEIGAPHDLGVVKGVRAMQSVGRAREVVYLTHRDEVQNFAMRHAMGTVDRIFIMVLGAPDFDKAAAFYQGRFHAPTGIDVKSSQTLIRNALGLSMDDKFRMRTMLMNGPQEVVGKIQLDEHPPQARPRTVPKGGMPPGIALVTFQVPSFAGLEDLGFIAPPQAFDLPPCDQRRTATCRGPGGELIELVAETAA